MKKSEFTQLSQIIERLVEREVKKQLPKILAEAFGNVSNKPLVTEKKQNIKENKQLSQTETSSKLSMKDLFDEIPSPLSNIESSKNLVSEPKQYTKNPKWNSILNETVSDLRQRERMMSPSAFSPSVSMAAGPSMMNQMAGIGEMMDKSEIPSFNNAPSMDGTNENSPTAGPNLNGIVGSNIPDGISALDVARQVPLKTPVAKALTKNYSEMMKLIDKKKQGKI